MRFLLLCAAWAEEPEEAERRRLEDELVRLAQRNTWAGVERTYQRLVALGLGLEPQDHYLAGKAALAEGQAMLAWYRFRRAASADPSAGGGAAGGPALPDQLAAREAATSELTALSNRFGLVSIYVGRDAVPALFSDAMPFAQEERDVIVAAQQQISRARAYRGLLPIGTYALDTARFEVAAGPDWLVVTAGTR